MANVKIAGAPISWGVCEVPNWGYQMTPERVLKEMADLGLGATEFGPLGFLPIEPADRAKVLAEHPEQRRQLVENPALIPQAIEELLRFEPPAPHVARYVTRDVEIHGQIVPEGSVMMLLIGAAVRDDRQFPPNGEVFDIHREQRQHLAFSVGTHYCLGSALARLEGRIALEELLKRFPEWDVDLENASLSPTSTVRGWDTMPAWIR